jgi:prepilin-type N-terminal cleavage/methylation domain-containing protein
MWSQFMSRWRSSFTLLELLIVIAIISMLVALTMFAMRSARESVYCLKVGAQLAGTSLKSGPTFLNWTGDHTFKVQWIEAATSNHPIQVGIGEFDLDQDRFVTIAYAPAQHGPQ